MTKDEAREILENHFSFKPLRFGINCTFPIIDENIFYRESLIKNEDGTKDLHIEQWGFKGLIKLAYDLEDKK